jgi:Domain of unknown function (DUF6431)
VIVARTAELAEEHLTAGTMSCPRCGGRLTRWGYGRPRTIRSHGRATVVLRPRRVRCTDCRDTHIVLPAAFQARRADTTAVIGQALLHKANGLGHRRIAELMDRAESTVRRWLGRATPTHMNRSYQQGAQRLVQIAPDALASQTFTGNPRARQSDGVGRGCILGPPPVRIHRATVDTHRQLHRRQAARPAPLINHSLAPPPRPHTPAAAMTNAFQRDGSDPGCSGRFLGTVNAGHGTSSCRRLRHGAQHHVTLPTSDPNYFVNIDDAVVVIDSDGQQHVQRGNAIAQHAVPPVCPPKTPLTSTNESRDARVCVVHVPRVLSAKSKAQPGWCDLDSADATDPNPRRVYRRS